jgi:type IV pilus assembly protein PilX
MLVLITLLAVSGMRSTTMEERMSGNTRDGNTAFQMAETALRQAEANLQADPDAISIRDAEAGTVGLGSCEVAFGDILDWDTVGDPSPCPYSGAADDDLPASSKSPSYYIEYMFSPPAIILGEAEVRDCYYRVTARGYGKNRSNYVTLQTTYKFSTCS